MPYKDPVKRRANQKQYRLANLDRESERKKAWRLANPDYHKRYRETHRKEFAAFNKKYYATHREQVAVRVTRYQETHQEQLAAAKKRYCKAHPEQFSATLKRYREIHREERNASSAAYRRRHPEVFRAAVRRRRARKRGAAISTFTAKEWAAMKLAYNFRCAYCRKKKTLTQDHVVPLAKGGNHCAANIVPACLICNIKKGIMEAPTYQPVLFILPEAI